MIAPQDLRIGNWVLDEDGKMSSVKSINDRTVGLHTTFYAHSSSYKTISPLPLSPEILEKCGFEKQAENTYSLEPDFGCYIAKDGVMFYALIDNESEGHLLTTIKYLHRLQNIVHALTNTELTITI